MKIILGILITFGGTMMILKTEWLLENFGRITWFEKQLGTEGGSRLGYKIIGLAVIFVGILLMTGSSGTFVNWALGPVINAGIGK